MKALLIKYQYHLLIVLLGLCWIALFDFWTQMSSQGIIYPDSYSYVESAKNLYVFHRGHNYRPILMAFINGFPYLFGATDATIIAFSFYVNVFCWLGFLLLFFEMAKEVVPPKTAFWITIATMLIVGNTAYIFHLLTENIFMLFMISGFYALVQYYKQREFRYLAIAQGIFILSMLIKPGAKFFAILMLLFFGKALISQYKTKIMWFLYGSLFLVFIQCAGIQYQFGNFTLSYIDSVTYYDYLGSKAMCLKFGKEYQQRNNPRAEYIFSHECFDQKRIAGEDLKHQLQYNTKNLVKAYFLDIIENTKTGNTCIDDCRNLNHNSSFAFWKPFLFSVAKWQNRIFTLLGMIMVAVVLLKKYRHRNTYFFIAVFMGYIYASSGISCGQGDRFHVITFPFAILLLAYCIKERKKEIA